MDIEDLDKSCESSCNSSQENINNLKSQALEALIQLKLKTNELSKYDIEISNIQLEQYLYSSFSTDINSLKKNLIIMA